MKKILLSLLASFVIVVSANANDIEKKEVKSPTNKEVKNSSKKEKTKEIKTEKTDEVVKGFGKILSYKEINKDYVRTIEYKLEIEYNSKNKDNSTKEIYTYIYN